MTIPPARAFRLQRNIPLSRIARRAGLSASYVRRLEMEGVSSDLKARDLARAYGEGADPTWFLFDLRPGRARRSGRPAAGRGSAVLSRPAGAVR